MYIYIYVYIYMYIYIYVYIYVYIYMCIYIYICVSYYIPINNDTRLAFSHAPFTSSTSKHPQPHHRWAPAPPASFSPLPPASGRPRGTSKLAAPTSSRTAATCRGGSSGPTWKPCCHPRTLRDDMFHWILKMGIISVSREKCGVTKWNLDFHGVILVILTVKPGVFPLFPQLESPFIQFWQGKHRGVAALDW